MRRQRHTYAQAVRSIAVAVVLLAAVLGPACVPQNAYGIVHNATVTTIVNDVGSHQSDLSTTVNELSGEVPAWVGGQSYTILTRNAGSGKPIDMAEQYVYEHLQADGLDLVKYQDFYGMSDGRNVVGQITGTARPNEIVVVCAHLDSWAEPPGRAPGADDNASSVAALLYMARVFGNYNFERTLRFVFLGGEEWDYDGSWTYARAARRNGERLVAVINADMLGWNGTATQKVELHTRRNGLGNRDIWIANRYLEVVRTYGLTGIRPHVMKDGAYWSDHWSFWQFDYGATCLIEDCTTKDNPYYHTARDTISRFTFPYYVNVTKGLAGTVAHVAYLQGTGPTGDIYVYRIAMSGVRTDGEKGARARVTIYDSTLTPVQGATVKGIFTGRTTNRRDAVTNGYGRATLASATRARGGRWTCMVTGVTKSGWTYNPSLNLVTSATITVR